MTDIVERLGGIQEDLKEQNARDALGYAMAEIERLRKELENANTQRERTLDECERMAAEIEKLKQGY